MMKGKIIKPLINHYFSPRYPVEAVLYITEKCNLKCKFCEIGLANREGRAGGRELSTEQIDKIIEGMNTMKIPSMYITGGEPFLAKNFWYLLERCAEHSIVVSGITTNGSLLGRLSGEKVRLLNKANVRRIIISIDYADAQRHDSLRGRQGLFESINDFFKSDKSSAIAASYCLSAVISSDNYHEVSRIVQWGANMGKIRHINFQPVCVDSIFTDYGDKEKEKIPFLIKEDSLGDLQRCIDDAVSTAERLKMSTTLPFLKIWIKDYFRYVRTDTYFFNKVMRGFICSKPYNFIHINYNGDMLACTHIGPVGNIDDGCIVEQWRKSAIKYKDILNRGKYFKQCRSCFCDFGANFRYSLLYKPLTNANLLLKMAVYYLRRYLENTV